MSDDHKAKQDEDDKALEEAKRVMARMLATPPKPHKADAGKGERMPKASLASKSGGSKSTSKS